jgi:hypothetical protein
MPIPMPPNASWRSTAADPPAAPRGDLALPQRGDPALPQRGDLALPQRRAAPSLTGAVAAIVALAAHRARIAGTLDALREAVAAALDSADQAPGCRAEGRGGPQRRAAAEPAPEEARLRALFGGAPPL